MNTELFIGWRYLAAKRKGKFLSFISFFSVIGIAIGVMALIIVIGVMTGFDKDLKNKIIGNYSHITITSYNGIRLDKYQELEKKIEGNQQISGVSPYVQGQVLLKEASRYYAVGIRGIDPLKEARVTDLQKYMVRGTSGALSEDNTIVIGKELASYLGIGVDSDLLLYSASGKEYTLKVVGVFRSGMYDYDLNLVYTNLATSQHILGVKDISAVAVKLKNPDRADAVKKELRKNLSFDYDVKSWNEVNPNFFAALKLEKIVMFIILTLIILVASFNIMSTLSIMVVEKTKDIGILKAIGMGSGQVRRIFTYGGLIMGSLGIFFGSCAGAGICLLLQKYQFIRLPQDIYYISTLPVSLDWLDILVIVVSAMLITLLASLYPAHKAAQLQPVEALRYE